MKVHQNKGAASDVSEMISEWLESIKLSEECISKTVSTRDSWLGRIDFPEVYKLVLHLLGTSGTSVKWCHWSGRVQTVATSKQTDSYWNKKT